MGIGRIFKRIALIIAILGIIGVILFIVLISLIRLDFRNELAPISKKEKESTYLYFIEKTDTYVLYNWNKKDTIFLK